MSDLIERVAKAQWDARQEAHGHWPDDGPWEQLPEMVKDWVRAEARAAVEVFRARMDELYFGNTEKGANWGWTTLRDEVRDALNE